MGIIFIEVGIGIEIVGVTIISMSLLRKFNRTRIIFPRLFEENNQERVDETLLEIGKNLEGFSRDLFFGLFFVIIGLFVHLMGLMLDFVP